MRLFLLALALLTAAARPADEFSSLTYIEPGEQFALGGNQRGAFVVKARNRGPVPVRVAERLAAGNTLERAQLAPGQTLTLRFGAGSTALVRNGSPRRAELSFKLSGDVRQGLGMRYEALPK